MFAADIRDAPEQPRKSRLWEFRLSLLNLDDISIRAPAR